MGSPSLEVFERRSSLIISRFLMDLAQSEALVAPEALLRLDKAVCFHVWLWAGGGRLRMAVSAKLEVVSFMRDNDEACGSPGGLRNWNLYSSATMAIRRPAEAVGGCMQPWRATDVGFQGWGCQNPWV